MIYIFEDNKLDVITTFFRQAYINKGKHFIYTNGSGNILSTVEELLRTTNERLGVFLDMVPGKFER